MAMGTRPGTQWAPSGWGGLQVVKLGQGEGVPSPQPGVRCCARLRCPQRRCASREGAQPQNDPGDTGMA